MGEESKEKLNPVKERRRKSITIKEDSCRRRRKPNEPSQIEKRKKRKLIQERSCAEANKGERGGLLIEKSRRDKNIVKGEERKISRGKKDKQN